MLDLILWAGVSKEHFYKLEVRKCAIHWGNYNVHCKQFLEIVSGECNCGLALMSGKDSLTRNIWYLTYAALTRTLTYSV